ncbi:hypothetical protein P153DRAFT_357394 [Dothidotthia symphoricarpi CBS 119687]|uniref:DUF1640-domain-containing protein n=1 Tax=Dothidotthia symphoricarpi CBS 119687 TaxID=1392245 RepID=A0A6A6ABE2_9PLEO|nr:uncharacterized protein P153DRAFT_357394 [Dothidotthia symphoricarpi CBS 119687]KAF2128896.1 hypothetical protein P153DRAFT_357394 [Dothidotthia symphoricarpi CBS 119687]
MTAPRLPFLWPTLFKPSKPSRIPARARAPLQTTPRRRCLATTAHHAQDAIPQRYGTAFEPSPQAREENANKQALLSSAKPPVKEAEEDEEEDHAPPRTPTTSPSTPSPPSIIDPAPQIPAPEPPKTGDPKPLDSILHMPTPTDPEQHKPPHLKTPPYVHHFDTYGLVQQLTKSSFTPDQSVTTMKAVRSLLITNMELAREGLVSKSNVENETYLFRAACSELKTEIGNSRAGSRERMRTERDALKHEVDIVGQRLGQVTGNLKDELKGLFDDRKMIVRQEQRSMETKLQELNYKITVALNSDARSEVEGLRWVLTRRAAIAIGASAFFLFVGLRYSSYLQHQLQEERRQGRKQPPPPPPPDDPHPAAPPSNNTPSTVELGGELLASEGVSLG